MAARVEGPKSKYLVKPTKVICHGGPYNGREVASYDWRGPDKVIPLPTEGGKYILGEYVREFYKQPKGKPREHFEEITPCYTWEETP